MNNLSYKAHDIVFAVFRVATLIRNAGLRRELEDAAIGFLSKFDEQALHLGLPTVFDKLERFILIAKSVKEMKDINADVLIREIGYLQKAMQEKIKAPAAGPDIDLGKEFPVGNLNIERFNDLKIETLKPSYAKAMEGRDLRAKDDLLMEELPLSANNESSTNIRIGSDAANDLWVSGNGEISKRQESVLNKIRETQLCRLRNLMETFPDISERTIRNDIQTLINRRLVRRVGGGGPNSYFESLEVSLPTETHLQKA
ncbi:MAG: hypothetical protein A3B23_00205 [Candidatus Colwellbacteria bacterium RIFCSPLOWO2_01_FULL_48_10]|uniref:HTH deoR-type domain-containing protein n=1 Tax=Candidatus Colwellbacteria bacterium RIFCSPLOWO2_01_FULL_48_10 TaxID=1797690 RepID=A0A1G1Z6Q3_9BACT|nr:MAG: hypothetical protein A3B23_00205 [Candidatus Colwellbacteria bacterium RIFCSPLOWO2_01_FULL_48_10]